MTFIHNPHRLALPVNFKEKDRPFFEPHFNFILRKPVLSIMQNVLYFDNGVVTDIWFNKEVNYLPWLTWGQDYKKSFWIGKILRALKARKLKVCLDSKQESGIIANAFSGNYFHWITEGIPKILFLKSKYPKSTIIFFDHFLEDFHKTSLELLQMDYRVITADVIFFKKVCTVSNFSDYPGYYHHEWIRTVRDLFLSAKCEGLLRSSNRLYISRIKAGRRKIHNENEIRPVLEKYGFSVVYPEELGFMESIELYRNAEVLVSCHGAALTNMIFLPSHAKVLELQMRGVLTDKCYYLLSNACGLNYYYQGCDSTYVSLDHVNADIIVDVRELDTNLSLMLQK